MSYGKSVTVDLPFGKAVQRVREVLTGQGFGVLTEIDVRQTLQRKPVDRPELREVADEASRRLDAALAELTG